ncbi:hypothetical protein OS493_037611 [Desmophyllum pertusum]|uniref:Uncharacterized protein n=1 Tax=Desmophyllum pertusum TaxID=174260 RepID=A0A9W9ZHU2_9CNID|nr:hypothetical protein OS493_037611 [Desmophyllum pertusum]
MSASPITKQLWRVSTLVFGAEYERFVVGNRYHGNSGLSRPRSPLLITADGLRRLDDVLGNKIGVPLEARSSLRNQPWSELREYHTESELHESLQDGSMDKIWLFGDCNMEDEDFMIVDEWDAPRLGVRIQFANKINHDQNFTECLKDAKLENFLGQPTDDANASDSNANDSEPWDSDDLDYNDCLRKHSTGKSGRDTRLPPICEQVGTCLITFCWPVLVFLSP